ncbi:MAG: AAA family ATPase [Thermoplasmata archaeon]
MIDRVVCVGGPPGSGKSTAARKIADALALEYHSAGEIFRAEAQKQQMDLIAFSHYAEGHEEVDRAIDRTMLAQARPGRILDARLAGPLCRRESIPVHYLIVTASEGIRATRLAHRDGVPLARAQSEMQERETSEKARYLRLYGIDLTREAGDLTVDSSHLAPARVVAELIGHLDPAATPPTV